LAIGDLLSQQSTTGVTLADVANRNFTIVTEDMVVYDVIDRMWRKNAIMAVVVGADGSAKADNVRGVITKEHVADSVANGMKMYPR
jgi:CIC family chloride channel protein